MALGFVLLSVADGKNRYFYAHENKTNLMLGSHDFFPTKQTCWSYTSLDDVIIVELSARKRSSTKWKFSSATNVTFSAALLKSVPVGCKDVLIPPHLAKQADVSCFT